MAKHNEMGRRGEEIALEFIRKKGYNILDTNWRHRKAEIDIIAKSKDVLIFIEVKSRSSDYYGRPETFVTTKKQQLISLVLGAMALVAFYLFFNWFFF